MVITLILIISLLVIKAILLFIFLFYFTTYILLRNIKEYIINREINIIYNKRNKSNSIRS
jgi:hypothetical protein